MRPKRKEVNEALIIPKELNLITSLNSLQKKVIHFSHIFKSLVKLKYFNPLNGDSKAKVQKEKKRRKGKD